MFGDFFIWLVSVRVSFVWIYVGNELVEVVDRVIRGYVEDFCFFLR